MHLDLSPAKWRPFVQGVIGRIRLSVSTVNRTYELSEITHVTPFRKYGKHSTGTSKVTYGPWARAYSKLFSCKPVLTVCSYGAQSNEICTYGRVSRGSIPRVRRYGLLFLQTVEYDQYYIIQPVNLTHRIMGSRFDCTKGLGKITLCSAVQSPKSWVAQRTTHGGPYMLWSEMTIKPL